MEGPWGGTGERGSECGGFLIVERVFGMLNWDSRARDEPPAAGVSQRYCTCRFCGKYIQSLDVGPGYSCPAFLIKNTFLTRRQGVVVVNRSRLFRHPKVQIRIKTYSVNICLSPYCFT